MNILWCWYIDTMIEKVDTIVNASEKRFTETDLQESGLIPAFEREILSQGCELIHVEPEALAKWVDTEIKISLIGTALASQPPAMQYALAKSGMFGGAEVAKVASLLEGMQSGRGLRADLIEVLDQNFAGIKTREVMMGEARLGGLRPDNESVREQYSEALRSYKTIVIGDGGGEDFDTFLRALTSISGGWTDLDPTLKDRFANIATHEREHASFARDGLRTIGREDLAPIFTLTVMPLDEGVLIFQSNTVRADNAFAEGKLSVQEFLTFWEHAQGRPQELSDYDKVQFGV